MNETVRLEPSTITPILESVLSSHDFSAERAALCARLFVEASLDGVASHGLHRFPQFIDSIAQGLVIPGHEPALVRSVNNFESWDGNLGPGNLNAHACMGRAIALARSHGMGAVALRNTNHWMRGGSYGLQAAMAGCVALCMTNTKPNMPPWGGREPKVGNNPFVIAVPHEPYPILLDMAMSQFAYGRLEVMEQRGEKLPFAGGFDENLELSDDPRAILDSELALPMGYWKGSGLAVMIDLLVSTLSGGLSTPEIGRFDDEHAISQLFLAIDLQGLAEQDDRGRVVEAITASLRDCAPLDEGGSARYPGERTWARRQENERNGIPVDAGTWRAILALAEDREES